MRVNTDMKLNLKSDSPATDVVEKSDLDGAEVKDEEVKDITDSMEERPRSTEAKPAAGGRRSTRVSAKIGEDENRRSAVRESRGFSAVETASTRISGVKDAGDRDADEGVSELRLEVTSDASGRYSSSDVAPPRYFLYCSIN